MSSSKMSLLRSASSLKRAKAALMSASLSISTPSSCRRCLKALRPESLPSTILLARPADVLGAHDLVGVARLEHAVLVDARGVGEGVGADHRLVRLHDEAGGLATPGARPARCGVVSMPELEPEVVLAGLHRHHDLLERAVAGALAEAVDGAFDLPRAADLHAGERVGHRHAEVVVAMHRPDRLVGVRDALAQRRDEVAVELGNRIADGVGHVDRGRAFVDHGLEHAAQEVEVAAVAVLGRELDVAATGCARSAPTAWPARTPGRGVMRSFFSMCSGAGGDEGVDARRCAAPFSASAAREMSRSLARESEQTVESLIALGDRLHRLEVAVGAWRQSRPRSRRPSAARAGGRCAASRPWSSRRRATARRRARWCRK